MRQRAKGCGVVLTGLVTVLSLAGMPGNASAGAGHADHGAANASSQKHQGAPLSTATMAGRLMLQPVGITGATRPGTSASAARSGPYLIRSFASDQCLDADLSTIGRDGTKVQLWHCIDANTNQWWYIDDIGGGVVRFASYYSGQVLDADLSTIGRDGTKVQLWHTIDANTNQWWSIGTVGTCCNLIQSYYSGQVLDADLNTIGRDGTTVQLWHLIDTNTNQWWH